MNEAEKERPRLHELASAEVEDLRAEGIEPTIEEIILLNDLARQVDDPDGVSSVAAGLPARAGSVVLWPLTIAGDVFFDRWVDRIDSDDRFSVYFLAFVLAHGRTAGAFDLLTDYSSVRSAVLEWGERIDATFEELTVATDRVTRNDKRNSAAVDAIKLELAEIDAKRFGTAGESWTPLVAWLCATCGGPPEIWERAVSVAYVLDQLRVVIAQQNAEGAQDQNDPILRATREVGLAVLKIREARRNG